MASQLRLARGGTAAGLRIRNGATGDAIDVDASRLLRSGDCPPCSHVSLRRRSFDDIEVADISLEDYIAVKVRCRTPGAWSG
jgi:hypothetical protein